MIFLFQTSLSSGLLLFLAFLLLINYVTINQFIIKLKFLTNFVSETFPSLSLTASSNTFTV